MKVLIVEDDPVIIESVAILFELRLAESTVISASDGEMGVKLARANSPDVIILDLGLPDMSGFEVLKQIRNFSDVPIIILTAWHEEKYKVKGLELGANDYVTKPFFPDDFLTRVEAILCRSNVPNEPKSGEKLAIRG